MLPAGTPRTMDLSRLRNLPHIPGVTPDKGGMLAQSASVCLNEAGHPSPVAFSVTGFMQGNSIAHNYQLHHEAVDADMLNCYYDLQDATADGAYGVAILFILDGTSYTSVKRSRKGSGVDYYVGHGAGILFQEKLRLEVSGILRGTRTQVQQRLREKIAQTSPSAPSGLPACAVVVEFGAPCAQVGP